MDFLEQQQIIAIKENVSVSDDFTGVKLGQEGWREQENKQNNAKIVGGQIEGTDADTVLTLQVIKSQPNGFVVRSQTEKCGMAQLERKAFKENENFTLIIEEILLTHGDQLRTTDERGKGENT